MKRRILSGVLVVGVILCCLSACNKKALTFTDGSVMEKTRFSSDVVYDSDSAGRTKGGNFSFVNITAETGAISGDAYTIGDGEKRFSFVITWADSGNPIYVGLFDAGNGETYVIPLEGGTGAFDADLSPVPRGSYYVIVLHQGKYEADITGSVSYCFK